GHRQSTRQRGTESRRPAAASAHARRRVPGQDRALARRGRRPRSGAHRRGRAVSGARMSAVALPLASPRATPSLLTQVGVLARRSVLRTIRQPAQVAPTLIFPLFMLAVNASGLKSATNIPGFPTHSYITFALAVPFMQGALFAIINAGSDVALDVETGFLN